MNLADLAVTDEQREYAKETVYPLLVEMVHGCLREMPDDPKIWMRSYLAETSPGSESSKAKGKGGGKKGGPPPPPPGGHPKTSHAQAFKKPLSDEERLKKEREEDEKMLKKEEACVECEIENVDLTKIDESAKMATKRCPRCELEIRSDPVDWETHLTSHSSEIRPWLFLGAKRNLENEAELTKRTQITHILNLAREAFLPEEPRPEGKSIREFWEDYNAQQGLPSVYKKIEMNDMSDQTLHDVLPEALAFIREAHVNPQHHVLVNCVQGISRSASIVIAYLVENEDMTLRDAYNHTKACRSIADPRATFVDQLGEFEMQVRGVPSPTLTGEECFAGRQMLNVD
jgi:hypothetical protein